MRYNKDDNPSLMDCQRNEIEANLTNLARKLSKEEKDLISSLLGNDPLSDSYRKCLLIYLVIAVALLLWPFDFIFSTPDNSAAWIKTSNGIEFLKPGKIISESPAEHLYDQMLSGSGLSLEVWATPITTDQSGPARIISYSLDNSHRNFTLAQSQQSLIMRLRTTKTDRNGVYPHMIVDDVFNSTNLYHIVVTYDYSRQRLYVNGKIRAEKNIPEGDFSNWDPSHYLVLGNEVNGERPWEGKLYYVSIYNRALEPHEIHLNFLEGAFWKPDSQKDSNLVSSGLVARYIFNEHTGDNVKNSSKNTPLLNLHLPHKLQPHKNRFLTFSFSQFANMHLTSLNILIFIPLGFLFSGVTQKKNLPPAITLFIVVITGALFTISIESVQFFLVSRSSSLIDVINNILGTILGIVLFRSWKKRLESQSKNLQENLSSLSSIG